ncbi:unnamed protein product, partial [Prorocentrum cordatum]
VLKPLVDSKGKSFLKYDEHEQVMKAGTLPDLIKRAHDYLDIMHGLQNNLSFKRAQIKSVATAIANEYKEKWKLSGPMVRDYAITMERRMCNIHHVVGHAMRKKTPPGWVNELPWKDTKDTKSSKQQKDTEGTEFAYGFRKDLLLAYRAPMGRNGQPTKRLELALPPDVEKLQKLPATPKLPAVFPDGSEHSFDDVAVGQVIEMMASRSSAQSAEDALWESETKGTHNKITIEQRVDRALLASIYEQTKQIAQVRPEHFGKLPGDQPCRAPNSTEAIQLTREFLIPIATCYCNGKITDSKALKIAIKEKLK